MRLRTSPFLTDVIVTTVTFFAISVGLVVATRLLAQGLGQAGFGTYSISRRLVGTLAPMTTVGMGLAIPRFVAVSRERSSASAFLLGGAILGLIPSILLLGIGAMGAVPLATLVFHDGAQAPALVATLVGVVGFSAYLVLYGCYRGLGFMGRANIWQLLVTAVGPVVVAWALAGRASVSVVLFWIGGIYLSASLPLATTLWRTRSTPIRDGELREAIQELTRYGMPRAGVGFLFGAILAIGPLLATYVGSTAEAGYLAAGQSVIGLAATAIGAFSLVGLPKVAQLVSEGRSDFLRDRITDLVELIVHVGLFMAVQLLVWADLVTVAWLGEEYAPAIPLMRIMLLSVLPYSAFEMLRSVVDAVEKRAVNSVNLARALMVAIMASLGAIVLGLGVEGLAAGSAVGMTVLGILTVHFLRSAGWLGRTRLRLFPFVAFNALGAAAALLSRPWVLSSGPTVGALGRVALLEVILGVAYWFWLRHLAVEWVYQIEERLFHRSTKPA